MVIFSRIHRATGGMRNCFSFCWGLIFNWGYILWKICFVSYISHQNYNSQGEWRSDREVLHQGQGSHLKVTFQSMQQMPPIYLSSVLSAALVLHPHLFLSPPLSCCLHISLSFPAFFCFPPLSHFARLPALPCSVMCWRGNREEAV